MKLLFVQLLLLVNKWQRWNDDLRVLLDKIVPQLDKVDIESLDFPVHWVNVDHNH